MEINSQKSTFRRVVVNAWLVWIQEKLEPVRTILSKSFAIKEKNDSS